MFLRLNLTHFTVIGALTYRPCPPLPLSFYLLVICLYLFQFYFTLPTCTNIMITDYPEFSANPLSSQSYLIQNSTHIFYCHLPPHVDWSP